MAELKDTTIDGNLTINGTTSTTSPIKGGIAMKKTFEQMLIEVEINEDFEIMPDAIIEVDDSFYSTEIGEDEE